MIHKTGALAMTSRHFRLALNLSAIFATLLAARQRHERRDRKGLYGISREVVARWSSLQRRTIPLRSIGGSLVGTFEKLHQRFIRVRFAPEIVILQDELSQHRIPTRRIRADFRALQSSRGRRGIAIEGRLAKAAISRPESRADYLMRIRFSGNRISSLS